MFLVSKQNLKPSYWCIWCTKNGPKWIRIEKVTTPKVEGSRKKPSNITKPNPDHPKKFLYVALLLLVIQDDL
jgi:hypothetical protein